MKHKIIKFFNKYTMGAIFIVGFIVSLIVNIPAFVLANQIKAYSQEKLALYNTRGTFWNGSGLLVAVDKKISKSAPLLMLNWDVSLGLKKFIDIKFTIGKTVIAEVYANKNGINLDNLNLSLSISQVSRLFALIHDLGLSGNIHINTSSIHLGGKVLGVVKVNLSNVSSSLSPVNPLGTYNVSLDMVDGKIIVSSLEGGTLMLKGSGDLNALTLNARVSADKQNQMTQFITFMGIPLSDGSYDLKIF